MSRAHPPEAQDAGTNRDKSGRSAHRLGCELTLSVQSAGLGRQANCAARLPDGRRYMGDGWLDWGGRGRYRSRLLPSSGTVEARGASRVTLEAFEASRAFGEVSDGGWNGPAVIRCAAVGRRLSPALS